MAFLARFVERFLPALLMAASVALLAAGVFAYASPRDLYGPRVTPTEEPGSPIETVAPATTPPVATPTPSPSSVPSIGPTLTPVGSPTPSPTPTPTPEPAPAAAPPTRIVIASLGIDLPVVRQDLEVPGNPNLYPLCDVAQFLVAYPLPGQEGSTYIYGHARAGMFLPMLEASQRDDGAEMIGALVEVYTADLTRQLYEVFIVKRHATDLSLANDVPAGEHRLVLQTSEGPRGTIPKLQVAARPIGTLPATAAEALPEPRPRVCG